MQLGVRHRLSCKPCSICIRNPGAQEGWRCISDARSGAVWAFPEGQTYMHGCCTPTSSRAATLLPRQGKRRLGSLGCSRPGDPRSTLEEIGAPRADSVSSTPLLFHRCSLLQNIQIKSAIGALQYGSVKVLPAKEVLDRNFSPLGSLGRCTASNAIRSCRAKWQPL